MTKQNKKRISLLVAALLCVAIFAGVLSACNLGGLGSEDFEEFCDELLVSMFSGDALSINILIDNPEDYGLANETASLPRPAKSETEYKASYKQTGESIATMLSQFNFKKLTAAQQTTYNLILDYFTTISLYADYYYFQDSFLGRYMGTNANLPIYLDKYSFKTLNDVNNYLALMKETPEAFKSYVAYEIERCKNGYGRADYDYNGIIEQAEKFAAVKNGEAHYLVQDFYNKLSKAKSLNLTQEKFDDFVSQNASALDTMLDAYKTLAADIKQLLADYPTSTRNQQGLANYNGGAAYYALLFRNNTSSKDSIATALNKLITRYNAVLQTRTQLVSDLGMSESALSAAQEAIMAKNSYLEEDVYETMNALKEASILAGFPALDDDAVDLQIKFVNESMQDNYSPASYIKTPIDRSKGTETIYVNPKGAETSGYVDWELLSHEGYPGHLLQSVYFNTSGAHDIRKVLGFSGYQEGWGTYAQFETAAYYPGTTTEKAVYQIMMLDTQMSGYLSTVIDIFINYYGYSPEELAEQLELPELSEDIMNTYRHTVSVPANAATYFYGYLKILDIKDSYKGSNSDFNLAVLTAGPMTFELLAKAVL